MVFVRIWWQVEGCEICSMLWILAIICFSYASSKPFENSEDPCRINEAGSELNCSMTTGEDGCSNKRHYLDVRMDVICCCQCVTGYCTTADSSDIKCHKIYCQDSSGSNIETTPSSSANTVSTYFISTTIPEFISSVSSTSKNYSAITKSSILEFANDTIGPEHTRISMTSSLSYNVTEIQPGVPLGLIIGIVLFVLLLCVIGIVLWIRWHRNTDQNRLEEAQGTVEEMVPLNGDAGNSHFGNGDTGNSPAGNGNAGNSPNSPVGNGNAGNSPAGNGKAGNSPNSPVGNGNAGNSPAGNGKAGNSPNSPVGNGNAVNSPAGNGKAGNSPNLPVGNGNAGNSPAGNGKAGNSPNLPVGNGNASNSPAGNGNASNSPAGNGNAGNSSVANGNAGNLDGDAQTDVPNGNA